MRAERGNPLNGAPHRGGEESEEANELGDRRRAFDPDPTSRERCGDLGGRHGTRVPVPGVRVTRVVGDEQPPAGETPPDLVKDPGPPVPSPDARARPAPPRRGAVDGRARDPSAGLRQTHPTMRVILSSESGSFTAAMDGDVLRFLPFLEEEDSP